MNRPISDGLKSALTSLRVEAIDYYNEEYLNEEDSETFFVFDITDIYGSEKSLEFLSVPNVVNVINLSNPREIVVFLNRDNSIDIDTAGENSYYGQKTLGRIISYNVLIKYPKEIKVLDGKGE
jgi:hypothetical protein